MAKNKTLEKQVVIIEERLLAVGRRLDSHKSKHEDVSASLRVNSVDIINIKNEIINLKETCSQIKEALKSAATREIIEKLTLEVSNLLDLVNANIQKIEEVEKMSTKSSYITGFIERIFWVCVTVLIGGLSYLFRD